MRGSFWSFGFGAWEGCGEAGLLWELEGNMVGLGVRSVNDIGVDLPS